MLGASDDQAAMAEAEKIVAEGGEGVAYLELGLLQSRIRAGEYPQALSASRRFQERYPDRAEGWISEGIALVRSGQVDEAQRAFEQAVAVDSDSVDAQIGLANSQLAAGDVAAASETILSALKTQPGNPILLTNLIQVAVALGEPDKAVTWIRPVAEANPENTILAAALARAHIKAGEPLQALTYLAARQDAGDWSLLREKGLAELRAGFSEEAVATLRRAVELVPDSAQSLVHLAAAMEQAGDAGGAARTYDQALALDANSRAARIGKARTGLVTLSVPPEAALLKRAVDEVNAVSKQYPDDLEAVRLQALAMVVAGQAAQAAELWQTTYAMTSEAQDAIDLSRAHRFNNDRETAIAVLEKHVERFPQDIRVRWELSQRYMETDQFSAAAEQLSAIVSRDWEQPAVHKHLAWALIKAGRTADALPHLRMAETAYPTTRR